MPKNIKDVPRTRAELSHFFSRHLVAEYDYFREKEKNKKGTGIPKTYLLEGNLEHGVKAEHNSILRLLTSISEDQSFRIEESDDDSLFVITKRFSDNKEEEETFFLDTSDDRFWVMNTIAPFKQARDFFIDITSSDSIDHAWFPSQMLRKIMNRGVSRGYGGFFDNNPLIRTLSPDRREDAFTHMSLKFWGNTAKDFLEVIDSSEKMKDRFTFNSARLRHHIGDPSHKEAIVDDWYYDGRISSTGKSFSAHQDLVSKVFLEDYKNIVTQKIEKNMSIGFLVSESTGSITISGHPIKILFNKPYPDLGGLFKAIFDGSKPFRLLGSKMVDKKDFMRVGVLDLHVNERLIFDLNCDYIDIYLPTHTCGNSIARFLTLFQRHFMPQARALDNKDEDIF